MADRSAFELAGDCEAEGDRRAGGGARFTRPGTESGGANTYINKAREKCACGSSPPIGFFSIVQKPTDTATGTLTIRARVKSDRDALNLETAVDRFPPHATD